MKRKFMLLLIAAATFGVLGLTTGCGDKKTDEEKRTVENAGTISTPVPGAAPKKGIAPPPP